MLPCVPATALNFVVFIASLKIDPKLEYGRFCSKKLKKITIKKKLDYRTFTVSSVTSVTTETTDTTVATVTTITTVTTVTTVNTITAVTTLTKTKKKVLQKLLGKG